MRGKRCCIDSCCIDRGPPYLVKDAWGANRLRRCRADSTIDILDLFLLCAQDRTINLDWPGFLRRFARIAASIALAGIAGAAAAEPRRIIAGPVSAQLVRVVDGDTIAVRARIWPDHTVETLVRLAGIDAPEIRGRCAGEIAQAERAKTRLQALLAGARLQLFDVHYGKYAGRVVARVVTEDGRDVAALLLAEKLVRAYRGGRRESWCAGAVE